MNDSTPDGKFKPSHRKLKKLYNKIRQQMEFYFSDSNLAKDKFLADLISKDPNGFVEIDVFKTFNKIKALTNSTDVIVASVLKSNLFEVSADNKKIRRITPLEIAKDFDACTLYVEKLPLNADQKWIKDVLGQFGAITYVNVPKYKATNRIKGFAFVEFESPEGVRKACDFYKIPSEKECIVSEDEDKCVKSAKKHKHEEPFSDKKNKKGRIRSISESSDKLPVFSCVKNEQNQESSERNLDPHQKTKRKRKRCSSESEILLKKPKESTNEVLKIPETKELANENLVASASKSSVDSKTEQPNIKNSESCIQPKEQIATEEEKIEVSNNCINGTSTDIVKTKRKRKNSKKHRASSEKPILRVMPKSEWKAFRSKYLDLQRSTNSLLKKQILHELQELKDQECSTKPADVPEVKRSLQFTPSIIIKVKLNEPVKNPSEIKDKSGKGEHLVLKTGAGKNTQVKANAVVAYVDAPIESSEIFIRCHHSEDAQTILKEKKLNHLGEPQLIEGDEEKKYWEKIETDRNNKLSNPVIHKKRGRDKLAAKAAKLEEIKNKHIYFDD